jgi:hypothetical protein
VLETNIQKRKTIAWKFILCLLPKLTVQNKHQRMAFAEWAQNNEVSFNNIWFSDEAHFHLDGVVREKVHHAPRITAWVAISIVSTI